jgi:hypothetical protein
MVALIWRSAHEKERPVELTFIGAIQTVIGFILLLFGSIPAMFAFLVTSGLFGGSAALQLPLLGGSSIQPAQLGLMFLIVRILLPGSGQMPRTKDALRSNILLVAFVCYGVVLAYLGPRLFAGQIDVTPLRGRVESRYISQAAFIYSTRPLQPTNQNITTSVYLIGTLFIALGAYVACTHDRGRAVLVRTATIVGAIHVVLGVAGILAINTPLATVFDLFRNGNYAQLSQSYRGFVRLTGIWPEASGYATYAFVWFVFLFECWLRRVRGPLIGPVALALALCLVFSTSSSAYIGLSLYMVTFLIRGLLAPGSISLDRMIAIFFGALGLIVIACAVMIWKPAFAADFTDVVMRMTVEKSSSLSGLQRSFWARQGLDAFIHSYGIGIGPGSFRSSSLLTAIIGCSGLVGISTFLLYLLHVLKPLRLSTYIAADDADLAVGAAASWAVLLLVAVASVASPTCDPGTDFAILAGAALALRAPRRREALSMRTISATPARHLLATG